MFSVLYVDDEPALLEITKLFLERNTKFNVRTMTSATDVINSPELLSFDAIVSDYQMPEMDGIAFLKAVRTKSSNIPFILFTGRGREEVVIDAINNGADSYLQKGGDPKIQFTELEHRILIAIERRQAIRALRESEKKHRLLLEGLQDNILVHRNARILYLNPACEKVLGYSRDALLGNSIMLLVPPEFQETVTIAVRKRMAGETFEPYELDLIRGNGSRISVIMSGNLIEFEGAPASVNLITDITARRRTEKALQDSERKYRTVIESIQDVFYRTDTQGNLTMASPSWGTLLGYDTVEECLGKNVAETMYLYPEQRQVFLDEITRKGLVKNFEVTLKRKDGAPIIVSTNSHLLYDDSAKIVGVEGIFRDITAQKMAEAELKAKEENFRNIFNSANDAIEIISLDENFIPIRFIDVNEIACSRLQYTREELLQKSPFDLDSGNLSKIPELISKELKEHGSSVFETENIRKDGSTFPVEINIHIVSLKGEKVGIAVSRDITERRKIQQSLEKANKKLTLLLDISRHDVMNQILALNGFLTLASEVANSSKTEEYLRKCEDAVRTIQTQISFTRDYQSIGIKSPEWQNISRIISRVQKAFLLVDVKIIHSCDNLEVYTDLLLEKVFYNLIDNSLRYGGNTLSSITVSFRKNPSDNSLTILCEDDGAGISLEDKSLLFERGFGKNIGLGLFLSREILSITGITIMETGKPGKGARFEILVPKGAFRFDG